MEIQIQRKWPRSKYIIGRMLIDGAFFCHTLEPPKHVAHPCIPASTYEVQMYPSAKFKGLRPMVMNVPKRSGILIHEGNFPQDTKGCILVGTNDKVGQVSFSKATLSSLMSKMKNAEKISLTIKECF